jgi:hypothetical protein
MQSNSKLKTECDCNEQQKQRKTFLQLFNFVQQSLIYWIVLLVDFGLVCLLQSTEYII